MLDRHTHPSLLSITMTTRWELPVQWSAAAAADVLSRQRHQQLLVHGTASVTERICQSQTSCQG